MLEKSRHIAQGKTTMSSPAGIDVDVQMVDLPREILGYYSNVQLSADAMYLNDVLFLFLISNHMHCGTSKAVDNLAALTLEEGLKSVIRSYAVRGFGVRVIFLDL